MCIRDRRKNDEYRTNGLRVYRVLITLVFAAVRAWSPFNLLVFDAPTGSQRRLGRLDSQLLDREAAATTASGSCVGVTDNKLRTFKALGVIDLGTGQILEAHWIDQQFDAFFLDFGIAILQRLVKGEAILES